MRETDILATDGRRQRTGVCVISSAYDPSALSGVGVFVEEERRALDRMGFSVHVIGAGPSAEESAGTTRVTAPKKIFPWAAAAAYRRLRRRHDFGIIHGHESSGAWAILLARLERAITGRGPRLATTLHVSYLRESRHLRSAKGSRMPWRERLSKWIDFPFRYLEGMIGARSSDRCFAVSGASGEEIGADYVGSRRGVRVIPNGVDPERFHPSVEGGTFRRELGLDGATVILYAGSFRGRKGVEVLIRAFAEVSPRHPEARLVLMGGGPRDYLPMIRRLGIADRTRVVPARPHDGMPSVYAAADIFCLPSLYEGFPLSVLEAMACGKAVIATRAGGTPEAIRQGESGILVEAGRVTPLARALEILLSNPLMRARLGGRARTVAEQEFPWSRTMQGYARVFRETTRRSPRRGE